MRRSGLLQGNRCFLPGACDALRTLDCGGCTDVSSLAPLAKCTSLHTLDGSRTGVISLVTLASRTSLHTSRCNQTSVNSLDPLATCMFLHTLDCNETGVNSLAPLSSCTALHTLECNETGCRQPEWRLCPHALPLRFSSATFSDLDFIKTAREDSSLWGPALCKLEVVVTSSCLSPPPVPSEMEVHRESSR